MTVIPRGATVSFSGRPFFGRCTDCGRLILARSMWWGGDFAGDSSGERVYPVRCTDCGIRRSTIALPAPEDNGSTQPVDTHWQFH